MSNIGYRLKVLDGEYKNKIGEVVSVNEERNSQTLKFDNGQEVEFPLYQIGILEWIDYKPTPYW